MLSAQENSPADNKRPVNCISIGLLGDGANVSLNYERVIFLKKFCFISGKIGAGYGKELTRTGPDEPQPPVYLSLPLEVTANLGSRRHFIAAGIGNTVTIGNVSPHYLLYGKIGYRFLPLTKSNISISAFVDIFINKGAEFRNLYFVPFGMGLGYTF